MLKTLKLNSGINTIIKMTEIIQTNLPSVSRDKKIDYLCRTLWFEQKWLILLKKKKLINKIQARGNKQVQKERLGLSQRKHFAIDG